MERWKARVYSSYVGVHGAPEHTGARWAIEHRQYLRRFRRFLPPDNTAPILDIGCGSGSFLQAVRSIGYTRVEGIDLSPAQVSAAHARGLTDVTLAPAIDYLRNRSTAYATITAFSVLEHQTRAELFELLDAIREALVPGGSLIAVVPNAKALFGALGRFMDVTHELSFTPASVEQICAATGFECAAIVEQGPVVHGLLSAVRGIAWQVIRGGLLAARLVEGGDWHHPIFTQDLAFVARKPPPA